MRASTAMLVAVAATAVVVATPALAATSPFAGQPTDTQQVVVRYKSFYVNSVWGAEALYRRLSQAASQVCADGDDPVSLATSRSFQRCRQAAIEEAVAKVDRPRLTAVYDEHYPDSPLAIRGREAAAEPIG